MENGNDMSSSLTFASYSYLSNGLSGHNASSCKVGTSPELLSLSRLSLSLEKLVVDADYDYSDAGVEVEGVSVGVNRCILAARSEFFHQLFRNTGIDESVEGKKLRHERSGAQGKSRVRGVYGGFELLVHREGERLPQLMSSPALMSLVLTMLVARPSTTLWRYVCFCHVSD